MEFEHLLEGNIIGPFLCCLIEFLLFRSETWQIDYNLFQRHQILDF